MKFKYLILNKLEEIIVILLLLFIVLLLFLGVVCRYFLLSSIYWSQEVCQILLVWLTFIGAIILAKNNQEMRVNIIFKLLPFRNFFKLLQIILIISFDVGLTYVGIRTIYSSYPTPTPVLHISSSILSIPLLITGILFCFYHLRLFIKNNKNY